MTIINSVLDLDDRTRLETFGQILDTLPGHRGDGAEATLAAPQLEENGRVLTRRRPRR